MFVFFNVGICVYLEMAAIIMMSVCRRGSYLSGKPWPRYSSPWEFLRGAAGRGACEIGSEKGKNQWSHGEKSRGMGVKRRAKKISLKTGREGGGGGWVVG